VEVHDGLPLVAVSLAAIQHDWIEHVPEGPHDIIAGNHIAKASEGDDVGVGLVVKVKVSLKEGGTETPDGQHDGIEFRGCEVLGLLKAFKDPLVTLGVFDVGVLGHV
tara:strand:- start:4878 stop:5198 length:321 start_codon:yes stop_codon:yes gene_type:complete